MQKNCYNHMGKYSDIKAGNSIMVQISKKDKEKVLGALHSGKIDTAELALPALADSIMLTMKHHGFLEPFNEAFKDKRSDNLHIPSNILLALAITAKLKQKTSLTDIPFAVSDAGLLAELGWNTWDYGRNVTEGLFSESVMRKLVKKYNSEELVSFYNHYVQDYALENLGVQPCIHILDCTKIPVNLSNTNYENSSVVTIDGETMRGYKLGVLRGVMDDSGVAEEIVFGTLKTHDMELCREMLKNTSCFHENDILINDRGFLSREMTNYLKTERKVDTYIPARENMDIFKDAVSLAVSSGKWQKHPDKKRKDQEIQLVKSLGPLWASDTPEKDVPVNACVVHDKKADKFFVFMTTDTTKTARQIIQIYELRPEIEEDFRQMKDFWKLSSFKSTKYNYITFHIIMTLAGYLFFQIYKNLEEGQAYTGKSLPVVAKNYKETKPKEVVVYVGQYFGIFPFLEFLKIYAECTLEVRQLLDPVLAKV